jgi:hypothetical protein
MNYRRGSLTVEAAIVLPLVMMIIVTLLMTTRIYTTYNYMDRALTQAAYSISGISYPLKEIGFLDWQKSFDEGSIEFSANMESAMQPLMELETIGDDYSEISDNLSTALMGEKGSIDAWIDSIESIRNEYNNLLVVVGDIKVVVIDILKAIQNVEGLAQYLFVQVKNTLAAKYTEYYVSHYFTEEYMKEVLFIKLGTLDYNDTKVWYKDGNDLGINSLITLCADYYIDIPFPVPYKDIHLRNSVTVRGLAGS